MRGRWLGSARLAGPTKRTPQADPNGHLRPLEKDTRGRRKGHPRIRRHCPEGLSAAAVCADCITTFILKATGISHQIRQVAGLGQSAIRQSCINAGRRVVPVVHRGDPRAPAALITKLAEGARGEFLWTHRVNSPGGGLGGRVWLLHPSAGAMAIPPISGSSASGAPVVGSITSRMVLPLRLMR